MGSREPHRAWYTHSRRPPGHGTVCAAQCLLACPARGLGWAPKAEN